MKKDLLIVFVKNELSGKVKTRLAKDTGNNLALEVYQQLLSITENETKKLSCDVHIYYSDTIEENRWKNRLKYIQQGSDIGERMKHAFQDGFNLGYKRIIGIGSDLPDLSSEGINNAFNMLDTHKTVFGPAEDGGYYLLGMNGMFDCVFINKSWSTKSLLSETIIELESDDISYSLLEELNDIDTIEDLLESSIAYKFSSLINNK